MSLIGAGIGVGFVIEPGVGGGSSFANKYSLNFDGVDDYTNASINIDAYKVATIRSFSLWVKINTLTTRTPLISGYGVVNLFRYSNNFGIVNGRLQWVLEGLTIGTTACKINTELVDGTGTAPNIADGNWHHLALYNAVDSQVNNVNISNCKIYLDGSLLTNDTTQAGTLAIRGFTSGGFVVGAGSQGGYTGQIYLDGNIDEVAYWDNYELSLSDIRALHNSGVPTNLSDLTTPPTNWYRNGDNGTWSSPQWLVPSNINKDKVSNYSFAFDGVDDVIQIAPLDIDTTNDLTLSCWVKSNGFTTWDYLCTNGATGGVTSLLNLRFSGSGGLFSSRYGGSYNTGLNGFDDGNWHHIAMTINYTTGDVKFYKDGVVSATVLTWGSVDTTTRLASIGAAKSSGVNSMSGNIDEFAIFEGLQNITNLYNSGEPTTITGALAHYKMGEGANFTNNWLVDNSALDNYSTRSFNFDGVDDEINCGDVLHNDGQTPMTLSAWVNISTGASHTRIYTIASKKKRRQAPLYAMRGWDIGFVTSGSQQNRLQFRYTGVDSSPAGIGGITKKALTLPFVDGLWHHVVVTYDGSESATGVKFYVDGIEDTSTQTTQDTLSGNSPNDPTVDFKIATAPRYGGNDFYNGGIDELAIWSTTALTQEQVTALYNGGVPDRIDGATSWWRMGEDANYNAAVGVSGNTTADDAAGDLLIDTGVDFTILNVEIGDLVRNTTTSSISRVNTIAATQLTLDDAIFPSGSSPDGYKITGPVVWTVPDNAGSATGTSANMTIQDMVGEAPNYTGGGTSSNMYIEDRVGDAPNSTNNALSLNMDEVDRVEDTP